MASGVYCHCCGWGLPKCLIIQNICVFKINQVHNTDLKSNNTCNPAARLSHLRLYAIWQDCLLEFGHFVSDEVVRKKDEDIKLGRHHICAPGSCINVIRNSWRGLMQGPTIGHLLTIPIKLNQPCNNRNHIGTIWLSDLTFRCSKPKMRCYDMTG